MMGFFTQMMRKGYLASGRSCAMYSHEFSDVDSYLAAATDAFRAIADAVRKGEVEKRVEGPVAI